MKMCPDPDILMGVGTPDITTREDTAYYLESGYIAHNNQLGHCILFRIKDGTECGLFDFLSYFALKLTPKLYLVHKFRHGGWSKMFKFWP